MIPSRPSVFAPNRAPGFVELRFDAFRTVDGDVWWEYRPVIRPRLQLVHTNGARGEGSIESAINWGNANPGSNTHPHYQVDRHRAAKFVPTNRKAIGNKTIADYRGTHGDVADWSLVIETSDEGWPTPGEAGGFIGDQPEMIAQILAFEAITHPDIVLAPPAAWWGAGTAAHTDPFGWPYWTNAKGKTCPGAEKKRQLRELILPRAREIYTAWTIPTEDDDDMTPLTTPIRAYDSRPEPENQALVDTELRQANAAVPLGRFAAGEQRPIVVGMTNRVHVNVTTIGPPDGFVEVAGARFSGPVRTSLVRIGETNGGPVATPEGKVWVYASAPCDVIVDVRSR